MGHDNFDSLIERLVEGLDLNAFYSYIDSKTDIGSNSPELVFQYTTWGALFNGIIRSDEEGDKKVHVFSTNCQYLNDPKEVETGEQYVDMALEGFFGNSGECDEFRHRNAIFMTSFSENENSLPMWNMYGKNGNGVSIGFDLNLLRSNSKGTIKRCLYDTLLNRALFQKTLSEESVNWDYQFGRKVSAILNDINGFCKKRVL